MDAHSSTGDAHSVSAVAVIDLSDGGAGDPHGLLTSSVVVIGGNEENDGSGSGSASGGGGGASDGLLQEDNTADEEDDDEEEDDDGDDEEEEGEGESEHGGCGEGCTHDHATPVHMIHIGSVGSLNLHRQMHGAHGNHGSAPQSPTPSSTASATTSTPGRTGSVSSSGKRKRVVLSIHEKQQVLHRLELGEQPVVISREFGISRQQVSDIKKNKDRILAFCIDAKHLSSLRRKTLKATTEYHPGVEQELYRWLIRQRKLDRGVTSESLSHKTTDLFMQYGADDAANVSFRSIHIWLRHFKRAHHIKNMSEDELAKLPAIFTPAMDMAGASHVADANSSGTGGSVGHVSPLLSSSASTGTATTLAHGAGATSGGGGVAGMDDVSSYMSSMVLPPSSQPHSHNHHHHHHPHLHQGNQYLLQNHAPPVDAATSQSFQMLMLSSATDATDSRTSTTRTTSAVAAAAASASVLSSTSLQSCAHLAQTLTLQLSLFEREIANKLDALDMRVVRLGVRALARGTTPSQPPPPSTQFA